MELQKEIKKLPIAKRILLVQDIWDSIEKKQDLALSDEIKAELDNRIERHKSGQAHYFSVEEVRQKLSQLRK